MQKTEGLTHEYFFLLPVSIGSDNFLHDDMLKLWSLLKYLKLNEMSVII